MNNKSPILDYSLGTSITNQVEKLLMKRIREISKETNVNKKNNRNLIFVKGCTILFPQSKTKLSHSTSVSSNKMKFMPPTHDKLNKKKSKS